MHIYTYRDIHINIHIHADTLQVKSFIHDLQVCNVQLLFRLYLFLAIFLLFGWWGSVEAVSEEAVSLKTDY